MGYIVQNHYAVIEHAHNIFIKLTLADSHVLWNHENSISGSIFMGSHHLQFNIYILLTETENRHMHEKTSNFF